METTMKIFQDAKALGIETDNHESDLYIPVTNETRKLVAQYEHKNSVTTFISQIDGTLWFDIPFAYDPWFADAEDKIESWVGL